MIGVLSSGIWHIPHLDSLLGEPVVRLRRWQVPTCSRIAGWGLKPSAQDARAYARRHRLPFVSLEDGFLRSVGLGPEAPPLSLVMDQAGIYYDASAPSDLEQKIALPLDDRAQVRAQQLIAAWRDAQVSKYNHNRDWCGTLPSPYVLLIDQTAGDASIAGGLADAQAFQRMLEDARRLYPDHTLLIKRHPEVLAGRKRGHFDELTDDAFPHLKCLSEDVHPARLLAQADAVFVVTSQLGFEALIWGIPVHVYGMPFYAGWGLTQDHQPAPARRTTVSLEQLVHAALVSYPRYVDPETGASCEVERVIAWLGLQRRFRERFPATLYAIRFAPWRWDTVRRFLQGSEVRFVRRAEQVPPDSTLVVWGQKVIPGRLPDSTRILRIEDGFLRSVGLGADFIRPLSWAMDRRGMYYDASAPSDLEQILSTIHFDAALLARAQRLRERIR
ncbi:MAG: capsular polysaccharide biosynthesis protein, partial [Gammaproteobacteria bacterium]|nr:capsular polysaccharide biosynthesis protein [Gammaproteobacteria bacterium]